MSQNEAVLNTLREHQGSWVGMPMLVERSGAYAIHSRVSDLRKHGYVIENRMERYGKIKRSYYKYVVAQV